MLRTGLLVAAVGLSVFAESAGAAPRCLTTARRERQFLVATSARPPAAISVTSMFGYPFHVHGPAGSQAAVAAIRNMLDDAWRVEIDEGAWPAPLPDNRGPDAGLDVYLDGTLGQNEAYVEWEDDYPVTAADDATCFMGLSTNFTDNDVLNSTVHHELNHTSQFAIDAAEDDAFFEHTAVLVEYLTVGHAPGYGAGIPDFQAHPERALDYLGSDYYEYGAALWLMLLSQQVGDGTDALARQLWLDGAQASGNWTNEPDFIDTLPGLLADGGWSMPQFFATLALWRYFTGTRDDGAHFADAWAWGEASLAPVESGALTSTGLTLQGDVSAYGAHLSEVSVPAGVTTVLLTTLQPYAAAAMTAIDAAGGAVGSSVVVAGVDTVTLDIPPNAHRVVVGLAYVPAAYDPENDSWNPVAVSAVLEVNGTVTALGGEQPGSTSQPDSGGCLQAAAMHPAVALLLLTLFWYRRRRA